MLGDINSAICSIPPVTKIALFAAAYAIVTVYSAIVNARITASNMISVTGLNNIQDKIKWCAVDSIIINHIHHSKNEGSDIDYITAFVVVGARKREQEELKTK